MSKKIFLYISLLIFCLANYAQSPMDKLIRAEESFAAYSVKHSTREAFLMFLDSNGIVFDKGQPVNGIDLWLKREKRPGILNWFPHHAEITASGDFGYTTGSWTFQPNSIKDSIVARGYYTTVWQKDLTGTWKFLIDLGVSNSPEFEMKKINKIENVAIRYLPADKKSMLVAEKKFISQFESSKINSYKNSLSLVAVVLNRNNEKQATTVKEIEKIIDLTPNNIKYVMLGAQISDSGDLGFTFGTTFINDKTDNYLRIWRREIEGWKIAVEVLLY